MRRKALCGLVGVLMIFLGFPQNAEAYTRTLDKESASGLVSHIYVSSFDQVEGGCWTNQNKLKSRTKIILERNNISTLDERPWNISVINPGLAIVGIGYRLDSGACVVVGIFEVYAEEQSQYGGAPGTDIHLISTESIVFRNIRLMSATKNVNDLFLAFVEQAASEFSRQVRLNRSDPNVENLKEQIPKLFYPPISRREMEESMSE